MTMRKVLAGITAITCSLAMIACGDKSPTSKTGSSVTDSAGVQIINNAVAGGARVLTVSQSLRLGNVDAGGPEMFSNIVKVSFDPDGKIYVANAGSTSVRVFGPDGTFLREFGTRGEGPAEVAFLNDMVVGRDTAIMIDWQRGGKLVMFSGEGKFLDSRKIRGDDQSGYLPVGSTDLGWMWYLSEGNTPNIAPGDSLVLDNRVFVKSFSAADQGKQIYTYPVVTLYARPGAERGVDWGLFRQSRVSGVDRKGNSYITSKDSYQINVSSPTGLVRIIRGDVTPTTITPEHVAAIKNAATAVIDTMSRLPAGMKPEQKNQIAARIDEQAKLPIPKVFTPLSALLVSPDGSFMVQRANHDNAAATEADNMFRMGRGFPTTETRWDTYDATGHYMGSVTFPARFRAHAMNGNTVIGVEADDSDVERVVRFTIGS